MDGSAVVIWNADAYVICMLRIRDMYASAYVICLLTHT